jgi:hypothetical protein
MNWRRYQSISGQTDATVRQENRKKPTMPMQQWQEMEALSRGFLIKRTRGRVGAFTSYSAEQTTARVE